MVLKTHIEEERGNSEALIMNSYTSSISAQAFSDKYDFFLFHDVS